MVATCDAFTDSMMVITNNTTAESLVIVSELTSNATTSVSITNVVMAKMGNLLINP